MKQRDATCRTKPARQSKRSYILFYDKHFENASKIFSLDTGPGLEDFFYSGKKKGIRPEHADRLSRILDRLNAVNGVMDMNYPGSKLQGTSKNCLLVRCRRCAQILILEILVCIPAVKIFAGLDLEPKF